MIAWYIKSIIQDFRQPVLYLIPALSLSACIVFTASLLYEQRRKHRICNKIPITIFLAYILVLLHTTFLCREPGSRKDVSLVLFETWGHSFHMHAMFIENIIMFIPFGVLLPVLFGRFRNGWMCVLAGFFCSCGIEFLQHVTQTGYLQLDDVVTNTAGMLIGWSVWKIVHDCRKNKPV